MSIATLKKKTMKTYKIMSSGFSNFSLNGTHRSQGYVGQTSLSRSLPKTIMKGNVPCGYGGCCGTYRIAPIVQSAVTSQNNPNIVKSSVINTSGMIQTKYRWAKRPQPYTTVKPDSNNNLNTENDYIQYLKRKTLNKINSCKTNVATTTPCVRNSNMNSIFRSNLYPKRYRTMVPMVTQDGDYLRKSYDDDYYLNLNNPCSAEDTFYVRNSLRNYPLPSSNISR